MTNINQQNMVTPYTVMKFTKHYSVKENVGKRKKIPWLPHNKA